MCKRLIKNSQPFEKNVSKPREGVLFLTHTVIIIVVVILMPMFIVLSSWQGHCKTSLSLGSCENMSDGFYSATKFVI